MDYLLQLARNPELPQAIRITAEEPGTLTSGARDSLSELQRISFLATQHPNAWVTDVLHAFYEHPDLAKAVWVNLRHTDRSRTVIAGRDLVDTSQKAAKWSFRHGADASKDEDRPRKQYAARFKNDPDEAVLEYAKTLGSDRKEVERLCREAAKPSDTPTLLSDITPTFLSDLLSAEGKSDEQRDGRTQELLSDPQQVRKIARDKQVAIPFSMVQEAELLQISHVRNCVRPLSGATRSAAQSQNAQDEIRNAVEQAQKRTNEERAAGTMAAGDSYPPAPPRHSARLALDMNLLGLSFSGGGIRSATFNLGVLQGLSKIGLLKQVDYLSTVSGGGYIGSWLAAWVRRCENQAAERAAVATTTSVPVSSGSVMTDIQRRLSPVRSPNPMDERVRPIRYLREYSNYLTPHTGFFSADTWTMIGIYIRNTLLNQVIIAAFFAAALLMPRNWLALSDVLAEQPLAVVLAGLLWLTGVLVLTLNVRRLDPLGGDPILRQQSVMKIVPPPDRRYASPAGIQIGVVIAWLVAAGLISAPWVEWALLDAGVFGTDKLQIVPDGGVHVAAATAWAGGVVGVSFLLVLLFGRCDRCWTAVKPGRRQQVTAFFWIVIAGAMAGGAAAGLAWIVLKILRLRELTTALELSGHATGVAVPALLSIVSLAIVVMLGMLGEPFPDEHREWWSRLRTIIHLYAMGWLAWTIASLYVPWALFSVESVGWKSGLTAFAAWGGSTILGVLKGPDAEDARKREAETPAATTSSTIVLRYAALVAPYVFVIGLVVAISIAIDLLYQHNAPEGILATTLGSGAPDAYWRFAHWTSGMSVLCTLACAAIGLLFSFRVDINEFSIHHFYKNRLVRCYLGASHANDRKPDWAGFDPNDDLPLATFDHEPPVARRNASVSKNGPVPSPYAGPYPIINCALNLVGGRDLAWQERKATSFVFTPKYCGYDIDRAVLPKRKRRQGNEAYVPTTAFYRPDSGPQLGMAMAISGAAANPNMGRASSPALGFLMTVFNVRLGWWIGNPRLRDAARNPGPPLGLAYTGLELFGMTDDERPYVNLSDGGHFDNLGVYELIRRNCRYIIVCDAGQDDRFICQDLGELVRRCRTDFGVEIDIAVDRIRRRDEAGISQTHCVVGKIHYLNIPKRVDGHLVDENDGPLVPGAIPGHEVGYLVYIKPSLTGDEPQDVLEYNRRIPEFPHQSTADQWFDESQFESYRKLGMHAAEQTFSRYQSDDTMCVEDMGQLMERLYRYWYPPSLVISERATEHATEYSRVMDLIRQGPKLEALDHVMFEKIAASSAELDERDSFYVCNTLIQLIENVYADLDLEQNWNHPHVEGWMTVCRRWAQQPAFRRAWNISEPTYAQRFRNFYNDRLRGRQLRLPRGFVAYRETADCGTVAGLLTRFDQAIRSGASVIELDVSLDGGQTLVCHVNASESGALHKPRATHRGTDNGTTLTFKQCLEALHGRIRLCIALRSDGIEEAVLDALQELNWNVDNYAVSSSNREVIRKARDLSSDVKLGLHVGTEKELKSALDEFLLTGADYLAPEQSLVNDDILARAGNARILLVPWIVNDSDRLRLLLSHDAVAGVISNDVDLALKIKAEIS